MTCRTRSRFVEPAGGEAAGGLPLPGEVGAVAFRTPGGLGRAWAVIAAVALLLGGCAIPRLATRPRSIASPANHAGSANAATGSPAHKGPADKGAATGNSPAHAGALPVPPATIQALEMPWAGPLAPAAKTGPPQSLWAAMRAGFKLKHDVQQPVVQDWIGIYRKREGILQEDFHRARPFLWRIVHDIRKRGMPTELALLPEVESAYNPFARSDASRATGLWQFMPGTAARFGLRRDWWYDGRRDILRSTRAALTYLQYLHKMFNGHWLLAIAAYNSGEGTVQEAVRRNARRGLPTDFWHLRLPQQTEQYVPELLALAALVNHPARYGIQLPELPNKPRLAVVKLPGQIDINLAARLAGIRVHTLRQLNPGFRRWATDPHGPQRLVLPRQSAARFKQRLAQVPSRKMVTWHRYDVHPGDTLGQIAERYGTTPRVLERINHLHGTLIRSGHALLVPVGGPNAGDAHNAVIAERYPRNPAARLGGRHYHVQPGDSLWEIARRLGVTVASLRRWNGLPPHSTIRVGQTLTVPRTHGRVACHVQKGDSLWSIAQRFGVSVQDLRRWNGLDKGRDLHPGQRLTVRLAYRGGDSR